VGDPPSGIVTFLFTDIEGSTRRWESDAEVMRTALEAHDELLRTVIEAHDGFLFKHTGDGVCAAFSSPRSAVDAAVAAQRGLQLPVRMGLATGEAEPRDDDYFGAALNRAARVMAAGHGGQILLADSTAALLTGVDLIDLGPRRLRGVPAPVGLYQLRASGLGEEFPPLRGLDTSPGNLRATTTSFIGRDSEIAEIRRGLRSRRLCTLTGVGGVGKTRLALEVAAKVRDEFAEGVWVFELASVSDPAAVPDAVAAVLGVTQQPGKSVADSVASALEGRERLLVLDNCEHVLNATADLVEAILGKSETVKILATSREGLRAADEKLWPVRALDVGAAAELFTERARVVAPGFSADEPDAIVEICDRLDGIPLAIELAASRMASMTAAEVRDRLDHRFKLLVGARRGLARHQTLRQAVAWSYDLLDDDEKALLDRCSVFAGGFDLESICAVAGLDDVDDFVVLDLLDALVRKSLLVADRSSGRTRFSMLETIRQFAEERLVAAGAAGAVRAEHARYFAEREDDILALWDSPRQGEAYAWFTAELADLRTAFQWAADHDDVDVAATIATYAALLGTAIENYEPATWAEELIEAALAVDHPRLATLYAMAAMCYIAGRLEDAVRYSDACQLLLARGGAEPRYGAESLCGAAYLASGQFDRSVAFFHARLAARGDAQVFLRTGLVFALATSGAADEAVQAAAGLSEAAEATSNPYMHSLALSAIGLALADTDPVRALGALRRGFVIAQDSGNRFTESIVAIRLSPLEAELGDMMAALEHVTLAIRNCQDSGNVTIIRNPMAMLATLLDRLGRHESAATIAGFAYSPLTASGSSTIGATITHLRAILGDHAYETLARKGKAMSIAAMTSYAYGQIDQARVGLDADFAS
jgi:predicted ATPase